jgi:hypothetical protein
MKKSGKRSSLFSKKVTVKEFYNYAYSGLYYKHVTIVIDDSSIVSKWSFKLIDAPRVIIYDRNMFIIQATGVYVTKLLKRCWRQEKIS